MFSVESDSLHMEQNVPATCSQASDQTKSANPSAPIIDFTDDEIVSDSEDEYIPSSDFEDSECDSPGTPSHPMLSST